MHSYTSAFTLCVFMCGVNGGSNLLDPLVDEILNREDLSMDKYRRQANANTDDQADNAVNRFPFNDEHEVCADISPNCKDKEPLCRKLSETLKTTCKKTCGYCGTGCKDIEKDCQSMLHVCTIYPGMKKKCTKSCGFCGKKAPVTCGKKKWEKKGCYSQISKMTLLINDRDVSSLFNDGHLVNWKEFGKYLHSLACRCADKAKTRGYDHFALRFWGECWGGRDYSTVSTASKVVGKCSKATFTKCVDSDADECVGPAGFDYVYRLSANAPSPNICKDLRNDCEGLKSYCKTNPDKLRTSCAKTCGFCDEPCENERDDCSTVLHPYCDHDGYEADMKRLCRKTCGYCGPACTDRYKSCKDILDDCSRSPSSMMAHCAKSCGFCKAGHPGLVETCKDKRVDCRTNLLPYCNDTRREKSMKALCPKTCGFCVTNPCLDTWNQTRCIYLKGFGYCSRGMHAERMATYCAGTCGVCEFDAPTTGCSQSIFGCCWDQKTEKTKIDGSSCPVCKDQFDKVCKKYRSQCNAKSDEGIFMRSKCPETCKLCTSGCADDPLEGYKCSFMKTQLDHCKNRKAAMLRLCPKTCGFC